MKLSVHQVSLSLLICDHEDSQQLELHDQYDTAELRGCYMKGKQDCPLPSVPLGAYREV